MDEQQRIDAIERWLQQHDRWLLVIDNLEDFSLLDRLLPLNSQGHVLLITQSQTIGQFISRLAVDQMSIEDGALLLLRCANIIAKQDLLDTASEADHLQAIKIAQEFHGYPLALDQAGAYIEETQRSLASYLELYQERQALFLGRRGRMASDHPDPVTTICVREKYADLLEQIERHEAEHLQVTQKPEDFPSTEPPQSNQQS